MEILNRKLNADRNLRKDVRLDILLPLHIISKNMSNQEFIESSSTINVSCHGLCTTLRAFLGQKTIVYVSLPMPHFLREYDNSENKLYNLYGEVRHSRKIYTNEWRIGVQFIKFCPFLEYQHYPQILQNHLAMIQQTILKAQKIT